MERNNQVIGKEGDELISNCLHLHMLSRKITTKAQYFKKQQKTQCDEHHLDVEF